MDSILCFCSDSFCNRPFWEDNKVFTLRYSGDVFLKSMWKPHSCLSVMGVVREETSHRCAMVSTGLWGLSVRKPHTDVQWFQLDSAGNNCGGRSDTLSRRQPSKYVCVRLPLQDSVSTSTHFLALLFSLLIHAILLSLSSWWVLVWHRFYQARNSRYWQWHSLCCPGARQVGRCPFNKPFSRLYFKSVFFTIYKMWPRLVIAPCLSIIYVFDSTLIFK